MISFLHRDRRGTDDADDASRREHQNKQDKLWVAEIRKGFSCLRVLYQHSNPIDGDIGATVDLYWVSRRPFHCNILIGEFIDLMHQCTMLIGVVIGISSSIHCITDH